jgi:predicted nucleic acid-binding Zn ribbon protein
MNVTYRCPHCDSVSTASVEASTEFECPSCNAKFSAANYRDGNVQQCLICPCRELYVRKDFSQTMGVTIVVIGMIISSVFWFYHMPIWTYATLFLFAAIDVVLYITVGNVLQCYQCQAQYRGLKILELHEGFDLEIHEKHRQQQIRLARAGMGSQTGTPPSRE